MNGNGTAQARLVSLSSAGTAEPDAGPARQEAAGNVRLAKSERCDFAVVGAGAAGVAAARVAAEGGARVVMVERAPGASLRLGAAGRYALIRAARLARSARTLARLGIGEGSASVDFVALLAAARAAEERARNATLRELAAVRVEWVRGDARFLNADTLEVSGTRLSFQRALIATGGHAAVPAIDGLDEAGYFTEDSFFSLTELPRRLVVVGGGTTGAELAQVFARLGSEVTLIEAKSRLLPRDAVPAAADVVQGAFTRENIRVLVGTEAVRAELVGASEKRVHYEQGLERGSVDADAILIAIGHAPRLDGIGLEAAEIEFDKYGVRVDEFLRTTNRAVYAAGAVCSVSPSVQSAVALGRLAAQNALFSRKIRKSSVLVPTCTQTDPAVAQVGVTDDATENGSSSVAVELSECTRSLIETDGAETPLGFVRLHYRRTSGKLTGAVAVAPDAGELIAQVTTLLHGSGNFAALADAAHPYPAYGELWQKLGSALGRELRSGAWQRLTRLLSAWRRGG